MLTGAYDYTLNPYNGCSLKLGFDRALFKDEYLEHYRMVFEVLRDTLPELGEGKKGFEPPF